ncbi:NADH-quinone oxidoreductase subunit J [bacterium]|nr:NADH-quinone oxidoreductase subunit J [bacterium]
MIATILFYLFAALLILGGLTVVTTKKPVHAVLMLIFCFFNAAALFLLIGAEYLAMTLVIVYVGAVAILFLFVVMMLDVNLVSVKQGFNRMLPLGLVMLAGFVALVYERLSPDIKKIPAGAATDGVTNVHAIGAQLYTSYIYPFQLSGLILLVAMVGAIMLTLRHRKDVRRQVVRKQVMRKKKDGVALVDVKTGSGV